MKGNVLVIATSPRKGGNSEQLADQFIRGASEAGYETEKVSLRGKQIGFCRGCLACASTQRCVIRDDADKIVQKIMPFVKSICWRPPRMRMKVLLTVLSKGCRAG